MKITAGLLLVALLTLTGSASAARADNTTISVMTRNQYLGGNLATVAQATDFASFLAAVRAVLMEIAANNFPERVQALALEIAERRPHIVGLQEVSDFRLNGGNGAPPFVNHLAATMEALEALGADYRVVASVQNGLVTLPADLDADGALESLVSLMDRDVILARGDIVDAALVTAVPLSNYCARPSADGGPGCHYSIVAPAGIPLGPLSLERGFVAVDVTLGGRTYRVVNTHLEVENLFNDPWAPFFQAAQATELKALLDSTSSGESLIVIGDINSTPDDPRFPDPVAGPLVRPFQQFTEGLDMFGNPTGDPYIDTWLLSPGSPAGYTCCNEDLDSPEFTVWERKDVIFSRDLPVTVKAKVLGTDVTDKTPSGLWPSDHAGVWARLRF